MSAKLVRSLLRLAFRAARPGKFYEPVEMNGRRYASKREADERWRAISEVLSGHHAKSVLDVGCAEGWFLRKAAEEFGCFAVGIDASHARVQAGEIARLHDAVPRVAVMTGMLSPADLLEFPRFDIVICLSVVHHVIRAGGITAAEEFMTAIASCARKAVIFEMGTSSEGQLSWSGVLPPMERGQEEFVAALLGRCGMTDVTVIASTPGLKKDANRLLFSAIPAGAQSPGAPTMSAALA